MPRKAAGIRLWLRPERRDREGRVTHAAIWIIRESGQPDVSTGCGEGERGEADKRLALHIGTRYAASKTERPLSEIAIADCITVYAREIAPSLANPKRTGRECARLLAFFGTMSLDELNGRKCREFVKRRGNDGGARRDLQTLSAAIQHHHREGYHRELIRVWLPPKGQPRDRWLTRSEVARLVLAAWQHREAQLGKETKKRRTKHIARAILLAYYTGSRIGDVLNASWSQDPGRSFIDLQAGVFHRLPIGQKQTNKRRPAVRLGSRILSHLKRWKAAGGAFVVEYQGEPIASIKTGFAKACALAGLEDVSPHTLRHTRATHLMQADVPDWEAAGYLGMSAEVFRKTYAHHSPSAQRRAADAR